MNRTPGYRRRLAAMLLVAAGLCMSLSVGAAHADPGTTGKLVLVLDSSGSMKEPAGDGQTKIAAARTALTSVVGKLPASAEVGLRVYGATVFERGQPGACTDTQLTVPIGTGNHDQLRSAIAGYKPYGETPIGYSLQQAAKDLGPDGKRTILLVSDGEATCDPEPCEVARSIADQGIDLKIDVIGFRVGAKARDQLRCVAREGRGDYYDADSTADLEAGLDRLSTRAFRPFRISGTPVQGAPRQEGAPVLRPGLYSDAFAADKTAKYYLVKRTIAKSTLRAGVSFRSPASTGNTVMAKVELMTPDGESCGWSYPHATKFGTSEVLATGSASSWSDWREACADSPQLVLSVSGGQRWSGMEGTAFELRVNEEPPVRTTSGLPGEADNPVWTPMSEATPQQIVPGSSFADAPRIASGSYKTTLMPGEIQIYKVKIDWGQRLQAQVSIPQLSAATARASGMTRYVDTYLISPTGDEVYAVFAKKAPGLGGQRGVLTKRGMHTGVTTKEVRYLNREGPNGQDKGSSTPGDYYVVVVLAKRAADPAFTVPMTLTVGLEGTAGTGRPEYVKDARPVSGSEVTPAPGEEPGGKAETGARAQSDGPSDEGGVPVGLIAGLGGGGVLLALLGVWAITQIRRRPAAINAGGHPHQNPPHNPWQGPSSGPHQGPPHNPPHQPDPNQRW
ncbi:vWA domain-containing protein [Actinopolymorpha alba]|uniref:vWA domain-containing protein n=1 Tax=Actinopolymorpha alba TaxID=533267 RepID=UPI000369B389|nr:VWA domain-containing protein [Actinopolymorpha alba]